MGTTDITAWDHRAGCITRRNGAWLIAVSDPEGGATPDEEHDAAGSETLARRLARQIAERWGFRGPWRWVDERGDRSQWWLFGQPPTDDDEEG